MSRIRVRNLGLVRYSEALALQDQVVAQVSAGADDQLLLLEHPHTYTLGTAAKEAHLLMPAEEQQRLGVEVYRVDRGGDITYHGYGQIVAYPIFKLARGIDGLRSDVIGYVRDLERVIIATIAEYGIVGKPIPGLTGVWVDSEQGEQKIAAIGVRVNVRGVTKHGFALNVNTDLSYFNGIVPCGIHDKGVTSISALSGRSVSLVEVAERLAWQFGAIFTRDLFNV